jgi:hypothetical protein
MEAARSVSGGDASHRTLQLRRGEAAPAALEQLKKIAHGFDAVFANTVLGELLAPAMGAGLGGSGPGASVVQGLIEQSLADHLGKAGGFGVGKLIEQAVRPLLSAQPVGLEELEGNAAFRKVEPDPKEGGPR